MTSISHPIPHRSSPGSKGTAPSVPHQDGGEKYATGVTTSKIHVRNNITIGTWNVRTLRMAGKLEELSYEMSRYRWNILGLCEVRWKNFGETSTDEGHKLYFCGINYTSAARRTSAGNLGPVPWERHPCCVRWLECQSRRGCIQELERHLEMLLQPRDKWEKSKASRVSLATTILCWRIHLANTKYPEDGHGTAQMEDTCTITRLIISWLGGTSWPHRWDKKLPRSWRRKCMTMI